MKILPKLAVMALGLAAWLPAAHATDGVIEINQAKIDASGSHTYTINQPGSYRLTSNLQQFDKDTDVILINADNVTLDLNGFAIIGANQCTWSAGPPISVSCSGNGVGEGVASGRENTTVRNGAVKGMGYSCVDILSRAHIEDLAVSHCGGEGISTSGGVVERVRTEFNKLCGIWGYSYGPGAAVADSYANFNGKDGACLHGTVKNVVAEGNGSSGINVGNGVVSGSTAIGNNSSGISVITGSMINNTSLNNGGSGILIQDGSVIGNTSSGNLIGLGVSTGGSASYSGNLLKGNSTQVSSTGAFLLNAGGNVCGGVACP